MDKILKNKWNLATEREYFPAAVFTTTVVKDYYTFERVDEPCRISIELKAAEAGWPQLPRKS